MVAEGHCRCFVWVSVARAEGTAVSKFGGPQSRDSTLAAAKSKASTPRNACNEMRKREGPASEPGVRRPGGWRGGAASKALAFSKASRRVSKALSLALTGGAIEPLPSSGGAIDSSGSSSSSSGSSNGSTAAHSSTRQSAALLLGNTGSGPPAEYLGNTGGGLFSGGLFAMQRVAESERLGNLLSSEAGGPVPDGKVPDPQQLQDAARFVQQLSER